MRAGGVALLVCLVVSAGCLGLGGDGEREPTTNVTMRTVDGDRSVIAVSPTARLEPNATVEVRDGNQTIAGQLPEAVEVGETLYVAVSEENGSQTLTFSVNSEPRPDHGWWELSQTGSLGLRIESGPVTVSANLSA
jgi:hypothetical protein